MQGKTINGFELKRLLGVGGMAEVWYAENEIGKPAAVKILNKDLSLNAQIVERFRNEAVVMVKLNHPNIRQVYGYGTIDERPSIVMEYLEGDDLKAMMKQGRHFNNDELVKWWNQLVDALNYTHARGIVHRDIKPSNIFVDNNGDVKLLDFGIAKVRESISMTQTGAMMGTLMYMSPEQVQDSKHLDFRSDVYSLAVSYVHLLTGKKPYDSDTMNDYAIRKGIVDQELDLSAVPPAWRAFLQPYLAKDPADRPALRPFESDSTSSIGTSSGGFAIRQKGNGDLQSLADDEGTIIANQPKSKEKQQPLAGTSTPSTGSGTESTEPTNGKPKTKKGLWIAIVVVTVVAIVAILFLRQPEAALSSQPSHQSQQSFSGIDDGHEWVDLGLPSGTLWATCNIGADKPEDYGNYFAWGEISTKTTFTEDTYKFFNGPYNKLTKYCSSSMNGYNEFTDNLTILQEVDDPAKVNYGKRWCTPSKDQFEELLVNTIPQWTVLNGVKGCTFTSKKTGMSIFMPAAGNYWGNDFHGGESYGSYWSRSIEDNTSVTASILYLDMETNKVCGNSRFLGVPVRPVLEK